jgi:hypothetical protein
MKRLLSTCLVAFLVTACAARKSDAPPASPAAAQDSSPASGGAAGYPQDAYGKQPGAPAPPPPSPSTATTEPPKAEAVPQQQPGTPPTPQGRALALNKASSDIEQAQRELDVAGSSCQNACRALGSMDRAAGHLCHLTQSDNTHDRCDDAKRRLYNARDKVRGSCGTCPDNQPATDRNAPIPSMR